MTKIFGDKAIWLLGCWIGGIVIYASFIPTMITNRVFPSFALIIAIFLAICFVPLALLYYSEKRRKDNETKGKNTS